MEGVNILHLRRFQGKTKIQVKEFVFSCFLLFSFVFSSPRPRLKKSSECGQWENLDAVVHVADDLERLLGILAQIV